MNAPLECFTPHLSGKVVFRVTFSEILPRTFDAENCVQMLLRDG